MRGFAWVLVGALTGWGCAPLCTTGTSQSCSCIDGRKGAQLCRSDGRFDPCFCAGPATGGGTATGGGFAGGPATGGGFGGGTSTGGGFGGGGGSALTLGAPANVTIVVGDPIVLSADAGRQAVERWSWTITGPDGGSTLDDPSLATPLFSANRPGSYLVRVEGSQDSNVASADFTITAVEGTVLPWEPAAMAMHRATNRLALVGGSPFKLEVHDLVTGLATTTMLNRAPLSVAFTPDGTRVVVGQDAQLQVVSLAGAQPQVVATWPLSTAAQQLAANDTHAYFLSNTDRFIHWARLTTGEAGARTFFDRLGGLRLHPDGRRLYGGDVGVSPDDVYRIDLGPDGGVTNEIDSRYHGDYPTCGNAWVSKDGTLLFSACGVTHRLSPVAADDLVYGGRFPTGRYTWFDESNDGGVVYALAQERAGSFSDRLTAPRLVGFERASLRQTFAVQLPDVTSNLGGQLEAKAVFVDSTDRLHLLLTSGDGVPTPKLIWLERAPEAR